MSKFKEIYSYFYLNENVKKSLDDSSVKIVLDTNILLDFYRNPAKLVQESIHLLYEIKDKLYLPFQVGYEYHMNKKSAEIRSIQDWKEYIKKVEGKINTIFSDVSVGNEMVNKNVKENETLNQLKKEFKNKVILELNSYLKNDISEKIMSLYTEENILEQPTPDNYKKWSKEAEERFKNNIPPGVGDKKKTNKLFYSHGQYEAKYGDYFLWREMCDLLNKGDELIFVTKDLNKDDWVYQVNGEIVGPKIELIQELYDEKEVRLRIIQLSELVEELNATPDLIKDVKEIEAEDFRISKQTLEVIDEIKQTKSLSETVGDLSSINTLGLGSEMKNQIESLKRIQDTLKTAGAVQELTKGSAYLSYLDNLSENQKVLLDSINNFKIK